MASHIEEEDTMGNRIIRSIVAVAASTPISLSITSHFSRSIRPRIVSSIARGCSWISLSMKCL